MRIYGFLLLGVFALIGCENRTVTTEKQTTEKVVTKTAPPAPDNTEVNERDRSPATRTPLDQDENQTDVSITADIRKRVVATADLSVNAQNVKIITSQRKVTLRGPVANAQERDVIDKIARDAAGKDNVDNQLEVETK